MFDYARLTKDLFASLEDIKEGRQVFVVARFSNGEIDIEGIIASKSSSPQEALEANCKASNLDSGNRLAIPVLLPLGLNAEEARGFKPVFYGRLIHIEFTP